MFRFIGGKGNTHSIYLNMIQKRFSMLINFLPPTIA